MASRAALLAGTNAIYAHLRLFGLRHSSCTWARRARRARRRPCTTRAGQRARRQRHFGPGSRLRGHGQLYPALRLPRLVSSPYL